jgi:hypothetical protein
MQITYNIEQAIVKKDTISLSLATVESEACDQERSSSLLNLPMPNTFKKVEN